MTSRANSDGSCLMGGAKDELEQHLSDIRTLSSLSNLTPLQQEAAVRAEKFAIELLRKHDASGHEGKRCPMATRL